MIDTNKDKSRTKHGLSFWTVWPEYLKFKNYNWITLNLIQFEIDWERYTGEVAITLQLLGFGVMWQIRYMKFEDTKVGIEYLKVKKND